MRVKIWCCTHDFQSEESEIVEFPDDTTDEELDAYAKEYMYSQKEPEWGFEKLKEGEEE
jgi:hypothetical protein